MIWQRNPPSLCVSVTNRPFHRAASGAFGCIAPILHLSRSELSRSPSSWSAGRLQLPVRLRPFASSFRGSSPTSTISGTKVLHYRANREGKWSLLSRPRYFYCAIRIVLMRQIPDGTFPLNADSVVEASCSCWSTLQQCYLRFEAVTSDSLCLTM